MTRILSMITLAAALPLAASADRLDSIYNNELTELHAVTPAGAPAPEGESYCRDSFGQYLNMSVTGHYDINTTTHIMTATARFDGVDVQLYPLGIYGTYAFMSDGVPQPLKDMRVDRIMLNVEHQSTISESDILFLGNDEYNCVLSNKPET